jgi:hypothetical protein
MEIEATPKCKSLNQRPPMKKRQLQNVRDLIKDLQWKRGNPNI